MLATQCLIQKKSKNMRCRVDGAGRAGITAKDIVLHIIGVIGTAGGTGCTIEFAGEAITAPVDGRAHDGLQHDHRGRRARRPDRPRRDHLDYIEADPSRRAARSGTQAVAAWRDLHSDDDAVFDREVVIDAADIAPQVTWGTSPEMVVQRRRRACRIRPRVGSGQGRRHASNARLHGAGGRARRSTEIAIDKVFIGSCTNSRIEDLRAAASVAAGRKVADNVKLAMVVPGSGLVKQQAEAEGLDRIFVEAGFEWREPGCSMCLAMNADRLEAGERCASTSNRNFEGRQGAGRAHPPGVAGDGRGRGDRRPFRRRAPLREEGRKIRNLHRQPSPASIAPTSIPTRSSPSST